ncbi:hypothetical protein ACOJCM_02040 [Billgrantia sp. LNSP4103-1]|uniref:hypothetical protein n=1 Tax=Billgrantia sp. LNSP4103-1 TaxID=3410266 RepID=UPI00403F41EB
MNYYTPAGGKIGNRNGTRRCQACHSAGSVAAGLMRGQETGTLVEMDENVQGHSKANGLQVDTMQADYPTTLFSLIPLRGVALTGRV